MQGGTERCEGCFRCQALSREPRPGPAPPRPKPRPGPARALPRAHTQSPSRGRSSDPSHSGRRCSGVPRCACACGSASDCSTASVVSPPPAPVYSWPRGGTFSLGKWWDLTDGRRAGDRARGTLRHETGSGARDSDTGRSTASRAGLAGVRKGRGRGAGLHRSLEVVPSPRLRSAVCGSAPLDLGPFALHPQPGSFACLHAFPRSPGTALLSSDPGALGIVPPRRGCNPRRVIDLGAHFPTPLVCVRDRSSRGNSGWCLPSPGQGLRGRGLGIVGDRRRGADWAQVPVGT